MTTELTVTTERVDDIPVLLAQMARLQLAEVLNEHCRVHGNWSGLPLGETVSVWLAHILSCGDHRLNQVRDWAGQRLQTLQGCVGTPLTELTFTDDRLAQALDYLGDDGSWQTVERELNAHTLRVYALEPQRVRLDSTTTSGYWEVTPDGLFQFGPSKDHRPDLPQVKVMLSALDPLGLPMVTHVLSGQRADDRLYIPAIEEVRQGVQRRGLLYIGDVKMGSRETRAYLVAGGDYYLMPLSQTQVPQAEFEAYLAPVWAKQQALEQVYRTEADGQQTLLASGCETTAEMSGLVAEREVRWTERRLIVRSLAQATAQHAALEERLTMAQAEIAPFNVPGQGKKRYTEIALVQAKVEAVLERRHVTGLLKVEYVLGEINTPKGVAKPMVQVQVTRDKVAIEQAQERMGWRVYATNQTAAQLSLGDAVRAYRAEYLVEHNFARLKGRPLSLRPLYLADDHRVTGLIRLLSLGLRVLTSLEFVVRRRLATADATLAGLYKGNPKRVTARPTAERLLETFDNITLSIVTLESQVHYHLTSLSDLQHRILALLDFPSNPYELVMAGLSNPPPK
jgi:transposase